MKTTLAKVIYLYMSIPILTFHWSRFRMTTDMHTWMVYDIILIQDAMLKNEACDNLYLVL